MRLSACRGFAMWVGVAGILGGVAGIARADDLRGAIEEGNRQWAAALARGDAAAIAALYTSDAMLLAPGSEAARGRAGIQKAAQGLIDSGVTGLELATGEAQECGDFAFESGTLVLKDKAGAVLDKGKYVVVWKKEDGRWKLHRDIFNTSLPAPAK